MKFKLDRVKQISTTNSTVNDIRESSYSERSSTISSTKLFKVCYWMLFIDQQKIVDLSQYDAIYV